MEEVQIVEVDIDNNLLITRSNRETVVTNEHHIQEAANHLQFLIHNLKLAYDIKPDKRLSDIIVAQELSLREVRTLLPK